MNWSDSTSFDLACRKLVDPIGDPEGDEQATGVLAPVGQQRGRAVSANGVLMRLPEVAPLL